MANAEQADPIRDGLLDQIGLPFGGSGPMLAPDEVNVPMIRHWVDALDDRNPIYLDEAAAQVSGFPGIVAPPAMLQTWTMGRPVIKGIAERGGSASEIRGDNPITRLAEVGFTGTLATNSGLEFDRYLRPGDRLESQGVLESISQRKTTGLGSGYFVTWVTTYRDAAGEEVGRQTFRVFKFDPSRSGIEADSGRSSGARSERGPVAAAEPDAGGEALPVFDLDVTTTVIVAGAIASRDFMPVHHDAEFARAQGAPDLFMNILTTNGYVARYVTDWAGPRARLERIDIRLGAPCVPGRVLRFTGRVLQEEPLPEGRRVTVEVAAINDFGRHATGTVGFLQPAA